MFLLLLNISQDCPNLKDHNNNKRQLSTLAKFSVAGRVQKHFIWITSFISYNNPRKQELLLSVSYT